MAAALASWLSLLFFPLTGAAVPAEYGPPTQQLIWPDALIVRDGQIRRGLACIPSGRFSMVDVILPEAEALKAHVPAHISGEVRDLRVEICSSYMGVGKAPATTVSLTIHWQDHKRNCAQLVESKSRVKKTDARWSSAAMTAAVHENIRKFERLSGHDKRCNSDG